MPENGFIEAETRSIKRVYSLETLHTKRNGTNHFVILIMSPNISSSLTTGQNHTSEHATTSIHHPHPYRLYTNILMPCKNTTYIYIYIYIYISKLTIF